ncbi:transcriptional regulator [Sphaerochaeta pleomorpha str. Grapes]|uniref:Transcriptional regulator n=1 Tax=Sphaerochaeta pleomorpha (strain ATCC BAA-1885 / DSM 22778 / Grapes) TaxID=158190 RepID=G8QV26_SPHPG|nr:FadR/GntR family transcriptional regulator [Sphaerochaeta pleomorpha]AEV29262.1 transcriptional regulator [Sphaerochaeta pleomorpha str. Grapes]
MKYTPLRSERLSDKVVSQILQLIHDGELKPGEKLPSEVTFSEKFSVSRGVIREAMIQLQVLGYIRRKTKDGTYIQQDIFEKLSKPVSDALKDATFHDLLDFRDSLESKMVEIVIDRASDEEIEEICSTLKADGSSLPGQFSLDHYFHYKLAQASRNIFYMNFIDTYYDLIEELAAKNKKQEGSLVQIAEEHEAIVQAIANRDKEGAHRAMTHHMDMVRIRHHAKEVEEAN